jgi:hypothetical protein
VGNKTWILHHDNTPAHTSLHIREFLAKHEMTVVAHSALLSRYDPCRLLLFPKLKSTLKGCQFQTIEELEENSLWDLRAIPQNAFQDAFQNGKNRWKRYIDSGGEYFEGDKSY